MAKQLTEQQLNSLRANIHSYHLHNGHTVSYSLANKNTNLGFSSNERLILFHPAEGSLRYYSKIPKGVPFITEADIIEGKDKVIIKDVSNFKCEPINGKADTWQVQWFSPKEGVKKWVFVMKSSQLVKDWVQLINNYLKPINLPINQPQGNKQIIQEKPISNSKVQFIDYNQPVNPNSSYPSNKQPYTDISSEIKHLRQNNKNKFNLTNQLSNKILPQKISPKYSSIKQPYQQPQFRKFNEKSKVPNQQLTKQPQFRKFNEKSKVPNQQLTKQPQFQKFNEKSKVPNQQLTKQQQFQKSNEKSKVPNQQLTKQQQFQKSNEKSKVPNQQLTKQQQFQKSNEKSKVPNQQLTKQQQFQKSNEKSKVPNQQLTKQQQFQKSNEKSKVPNQQLTKQQQFQKSNEKSKVPNQQLTKQQQFQKSNEKSKVPNQQLTKQPQFRKFNEKSKVTNQQLTKQQQFQKFNEKSKVPNLQLHQKTHIQATYHQKQPIFNKLSKTYNQKTIKNRQQTLHSLPTFRRWSEQWWECEVEDKVYVYDQFVYTSKSLLIHIIDELPFLKKNRYYVPLENKPPYYIYKYSGIIIVLNYEQNSKLQPSEYNQNAISFVYNETQEELKKQFNNYDLIIRATKNEGYIKVPMCCYFEYKGILGLCKAEIPSSFQSNQDAKELNHELQSLQQLIKCKINMEEITVHIHPSLKYLVINDIVNLIPKIPSFIPSSFTKPYLLQIQKEVLGSRNIIYDAYNNILHNGLVEFLEKYQALQIWITNTRQLNQQLNQLGITHSFIPEIIHHTKSSHLRKILVSEIIATTFTYITRSQINNMFASFSPSQFNSYNTNTINDFLLDGVHSIINRFFSSSLKAQNIWKVVVNEASKRYKIVVSKQDSIVGFLLSSMIMKLGLNCKFNDSTFNRKSQFFIEENTIPRDLLDSFEPIVHRYPSASLSPFIQEVSQLIQQKNNNQKFQNIIKIMNLTKSPIPQILCQVKSDLMEYLAYFIPFNDEEQFRHLKLYDDILKQPHTKVSLRVSMLAIKWQIKQNKIEQATKIFENKCNENLFWLGEFNPPIGQFYDFFSMHYTLIGKYDESIKLAKQSLFNAIKILGTNSLPIADKHYQLGNIYYKISQKQDALKEYTKTQQILCNYGQTNIPQYGVILLKISLLFLNFGKIKDCVLHSLDAIKIFDQNGSNQQQQIQAFQILARAYEIKKKFNDVMNVAAMCSQKFNLTKQPKIFQRMVKIVLYPKISYLNSQQSKSLQLLIYNLQYLESPTTYLQAFSFLHQKATSINVIKRVISLIDNIVNLYQDAIQKELFRKHKSLLLDTKLQAQQLLVMIEAVCIMVGYGFLLGSLKQYYYD